MRGIKEQLVLHRDGDDRQQTQCREQRQVELLAFELFVGQVLLAVRGELDLGADLVATGPQVRDEPRDEPDHHDGEDHEAEGSLCRSCDDHVVPVRLLVHRCVPVSP